MKNLSSKLLSLFLSSLLTITFSIQTFASTATYQSNNDILPISQDEQTIIDKPQSNIDQSNTNQSIETQATVEQTDFSQDIAKKQNQDGRISITLDEKNIMKLPRTKEMFYAISDIWHDAFDYNYGSELIPGTYMNFYVDNLFLKYDTYVYIHDNKCISMIMLIPTKIKLIDGSYKDGFYAYAGGTKKEYRGNGVYSLLLKYLDRYLNSCGQSFRILIPDDSHPWLYSFYHNLGSEFINCRHVIMSPEEIASISLGATVLPYQDGLTPVDLFNCRKMNLENKTGFIQWPEEVLDFVKMDYSRINKNYHELYFGDWQYAIIRYGKPEFKRIIVKEFFIKDENKSAFFKTLSELFPDKTIIFEMPDSDQFSNFFDKPYTTDILAMINLFNPSELKQKIMFPVYFNFGMD